MIAIDVGYSSIKAMSSAGKRVYFPSVVSPAPIDLFNGTINKQQQHLLEMKGKAYLIGDAALQSANATTTLSRKKPAEIHDLFIATAAYLLETEQGDTLAVGLPLSFYRYQREDLRKRLSFFSDIISVDKQEGRHIYFGKVNVFPQGLGALFLQEQLADGYVGIIDIGYLTTDYLLFDVQAGQPMPIMEACGSIERGVSLVYQQFNEAFQQKVGFNLPLSMQERAIKNTLHGKELPFAGKKINLIREFNQICQYTTRQIEESVKAVWRDRFDFVDSIIGIGGGMELFKRFFTMEVDILPDPVFANARGYLALLDD